MKIPEAIDEKEYTPAYANLNFNDGRAYRFERGFSKLWLKRISTPRDQTHIHFRGGGVDKITGIEIKIDLDIYIDDTTQELMKERPTWPAAKPAPTPRQ